MTRGKEKEREQVQTAKSYPRVMLTVTLMVLLPSVLLVGCRGSLGWGRMDGAFEYRNQSGSSVIPGRHGTERPMSTRS
jgi:hypothetical protein